MSQDHVLSLTEVLSEEFDRLRPKSGYGDASDENTLFRKVHAEAKPFSALCISGGGIRSATFALGAIQGMADQGLLGGFDYLSTVSGGGYIGSWLTSWKHRAGGLDKVIPFLRKRAPAIPKGDPDPIEHLREYNSYLSPKLGLFSADTWALAATVVRNMFLNWLVFIPLLMAALLVPRLVLSIVRLGETFDDFYPRLATAGMDTLSPLISVASAMLFGIGVLNMMRYLPGVGRKEHSEIDFLKWVLLPVILSALAFIANDSWFTFDTINPGVNTRQLLGYKEVIAGVTTSVGAASLGCLLFCGKSLKGRIWSWFGVTVAALLSGWIAGAAAWWLANYVYQDSSWQTYTTLSAPLLLLAILLAGCIFVGFSSRQLKDEDREWLSRAGAWVLLYVVSWAALSALVLFVPGWVMRFPIWGDSVLAATGGIAGWISALAGSSRNSAATREAVAPSSWPTRLGMALAAPIFAVVVLVGLAILTNRLLTATGLEPGVDWWNHEAMLEGARVESILLVGVLLLVIASLMARFININKFSLQAMYRNRLIRAYLGASNPCRNASKFTGFAENDNLEMHKLDAGQKPFHLVNVTLNLVAGQRLAWQQRKAESFTISPLHCGSAELGYRSSEGYGGPGGITLGTAVAISGAAASPNMGYHSSPIIAFIMTLFNARLGSWLGNPGSAGEKTWQEAGPTSAVGSLAKEAFGLTNDTSEWVYLSDGGHFENLALYEMVRRRCGCIVLLDGGCDVDYTYGDLGNALRKIRIDLKIPVDFDEASFDLLRKKNSRCAFARIGYKAVDDAAQDGYLIYIKPMIRGGEPPDVASYHNDHKDFPHETTADQFFNESQTESYRALGAYTITEICRGWDAGQGLPGLLAHISGAEKTAASVSTAAGLR
jgi:hypothetical protein